MGFPPYLSGSCPNAESESTCGHFGCSLGLCRLGTQLYQSEGYGRQMQDTGDWCPSSLPSRCLLILPTLMTPWSLSMFKCTWSEASSRSSEMMPRTQFKDWCKVRDMVALHLRLHLYKQVPGGHFLHFVRIA